MTPTNILYFDKQDKLEKIEKSGQFWITEVIQILELSLLFNFGHVEAEILGQIKCDS